MNHCPNLKQAKLRKINTLLCYYYCYYYPITSILEKSALCCDLTVTLPSLMFLTPAGFTVTTCENTAALIARLLLSPEKLTNVLFTAILVTLNFETFNSYYAVLPLGRSARMTVTSHRQQLPRMWDIHHFFKVGGLPPSISDLIVESYHVRGNVEVSQLRVLCCWGLFVNKLSHWELRVLVQSDPTYSVSRSYLSPLISIRLFRIMVLTTRVHSHKHMRYVLA